MSRQLRPATSTYGRNMAGARSLWRATGMGDEDFGRPIIAVVSSFAELVPGHVHLRNIGKLVSDVTSAAGGVAKEMNTIAANDDITMGHGGMLYSLPPRELIADSVGYMVNVHCVDAMVCISNCDRITPGMSTAAMCLNIPVIFVSGGLMEAGKNIDPSTIIGPAHSGYGNLVTVINVTVNDAVSDEELFAIEKFTCPTCGSRSGMFTANSMNCLTEVPGLSLPGNGSTLVTQVARRDLFLRAGELIVDLYRRYYEEEDDSVLPCSIASAEAFRDAMILDTAVGGSSNTVPHSLAVAHEGGADFDLEDATELGRSVPCLSKVAPDHNDYYMEDVHWAGGIPRTFGELDRGGFLSREAYTIHSPSFSQWLGEWDPRSQSVSEKIIALWKAAPGNVRTTEPLSTSSQWSELDLDEVQGCVRDIEHAYTAKGGLTVLFGNLVSEGAIIKAADTDLSLFHSESRACVMESQGEAVEEILDKTIQAGDAIVIRYEGPAEGPDIQEIFYPTSFIRGRGLGKARAFTADDRFSGGTSGILVGHISPEAADGGLIGLVKGDDRIIIDVNEGLLFLDAPEEEIEARRVREEVREHPWIPKSQDRLVSPALQLYVVTAMPALKGAARDVSRVLQ